MGVIVQSFQASLPLDLFTRLQRLRRRYAPVLQAAAQGDFADEVRLHSLTRRLGRILAEAAHMSVEERGGLRMLELSLAVDGLFPELRPWNQRAALYHRPPTRMAQ